MAESFVSVMQQWNEIFMRRSMRTFILYSKETGLSMTQIGALFRIHKMPSGVTDLGEELGITPAAASQMLEKLFQQQLILREENPDDRRAKRIVLTEKGKQIMHQAIHARQSWLEEIDQLLNDKEKIQVISAMEMLLKKATESSQFTEDKYPSKF